MAQGLQRRTLHHRQGEIEEFIQICRRHGLPLTVQRRVILEALVAHEDHPTTDRIFADVREKLPGLSRTTVYRVLETLVKVGAARKVCHPGASARFEVKMSRHHHLVCLHCEKVVDLEDPSLDGIPLPAGRRLGFEVADYSIHFCGICKACLHRMSVPAPRRAGRPGSRGKQKREQKRERNTS